MTRTAMMIETYPADIGRIDRNALARCIDACLDCTQTCTACADACLAEDMVDQLRGCIRTNLDCADVCAATARVLSRRTGYDANLTRAVLQACAVACRTCGEECQSHAEMHEHCKVCAEACRDCEQACTSLLDTLD